MARRSRRSDAGRRPHAEELAVYRQFVRQLTTACEAVSRGDLEVRSRLVPAAETVPGLTALHHAFNRVLDVSDAFVRESSDALSPAAESRFHRTLLTTGLLGAFRRSAVDINDARKAMQETAGRVTEAQTMRSEATGFLAEMRR